MKNLAIIPARSGSKGLKDKNIKDLNGKPLLAYSIEAAIESELFDEIMVSTDSATYAEIAKKYGAMVPFFRTDEMSSDNAGSWDVVREVLIKYSERGKKFDTVCLLQPTSPLREAYDIISAYHLLTEREADAVSTVCEVDHSPLWMMTLEEEQSLAAFRKKMVSVPRQQLDKYYRLNGSIYIRKIDYTKNSLLLEDKEYALIMDRKRSVDIDTIDDFEFAEFLFHKAAKTKKEGGSNHLQDC